MLPMAAMLVKARCSFISIILVSWLLVKAHFMEKSEIQCHAQCHSLKVFFKIKLSGLILLKL